MSSPQPHGYAWQMLRRLRLAFLKSVPNIELPAQLRRRNIIPRGTYNRWIAAGREQRVPADAARVEIAAFAFAPKISIVMPVFNPAREHLEKALASVRQQYYKNWELCVCDDGSTAPHVRTLLEQVTREEVKVVFSPANEGISAASNRALELASGEFVGLLDHDDELTPDALFEVVKRLQQSPDADVIYSDEDKLDPHGRRCDPFFKPDWSPEYLLSYMYPCHFSVYRKSLLDAIGGFRRGFEGSQDYDLVLRASERTDRVVHIPKVLYHWRKAAASTARSARSKDFASHAGRRALQQHLERCGMEGEVIVTRPGRYRVAPEIKGTPLVSIIIPTKNHARLLARCVESIERKSTWRNFEILVVDNGSTEPAMLEWAQQSPHKVLSFEEPFNFARINNFAARHAGGEYLLFLNDDTQVRTPQWLEAMLELCQRPGVGAVGAKLLFSSGRLQHAGILLGIGGVAGHPYYCWPGNTRGYFDNLLGVRNVSAVTGACMIVRRALFEQVGGFDEAFPLNYNDVDFCLRLRQKCYSIVWTPFAELWHHESATRSGEVSREEIARMKERWEAALLNDPYYNPNLSLRRGDYTLRS